MMERSLLNGRTLLVVSHRAKRAILRTADANHVDTVFVDRRQSRQNGDTLVITCEGNAGFYEAGCMMTPISAGYSVLGWNRPGFSESSVSIRLEHSSILKSYSQGLSRCSLGDQCYRCGHALRHRTARISHGAHCRLRLVHWWIRCLLDRCALSGDSWSCSWRSLRRRAFSRSTTNAFLPLELRRENHSIVSRFEQYPPASSVSGALLLDSSYKRWNHQSDSRTTREQPRQRDHLWCSLHSLSMHLSQWTNVNTFERIHLCRCEEEAVFGRDVAFRWRWITFPNGELSSGASHRFVSVSIRFVDPRGSFTDLPFSLF